MVGLHSQLASSLTVGGRPNETIPWWAADVSLVACLLPLVGGALLAAQLAAGRASRGSR